MAIYSPHCWFEKNFLGKYYKNKLNKSNNFKTIYVQTSSYDIFERVKIFLLDKKPQLSEVMNPVESALNGLSIFLPLKNVSDL